MNDKHRTVEIRVVFRGPQEERSGGLVSLPAVLDVKGEQCELDLPLGIHAATIAHDTRQWFEPLMKAWLWDYCARRSLVKGEGHVKG